MASIEALKAKLAQAAGVAQRQTAKIETRADALIARESAIEAKTNAAFAPHETLLNQAETGLNDLESALSQLSNGGPPLDPLPASAPSAQGSQGQVTAPPAHQGFSDLNAAGVKP